MLFGLDDCPNDECKSTNHAKVEPLNHVKTILVTGAAGFIGGWFVRNMLQTYGDKYVIIGFDNLEYCSSMKNFTSIQSLPSFHFVKGDIRCSSDVESSLKRYNVDAIVHLAAKTHVDNSFDDPLSFMKTNVFGTQVLLEACRKQGSIKRIIHVSTDEVYGENNASELLPFAEDQALNPTNPYAASKAAAEMVVSGYQKAYQLPIIVTRCNNVFGPCQYPEKLIPKFIKLLDQQLKMPIHGHGTNMRSFLFAADAAEALDTIFHRGLEGETYNISSTTQLQVLEVAEKILKLGFDRIYPQKLEHWTKQVKDRLFNDSMYWTDGSKLEALGWSQRTSFVEGLQNTIRWYREESECFWPN